VNLSPHITIAEATRTNTGLPNYPGPVEYAAMEALAVNVFEPLRLLSGEEPIDITSFYRSPKVNTKICGALTSQHPKGEAMDISIPGSNKVLFDIIREQLPFDQLIWEYGTDDEPDWIHVSYSVKRNRGQVLKAVKVNKKTKYLPYV
jgi:hypothetical protein